jgi:hypothetical protein
MKRSRFSYTADWSEYFGHQPQDGSGDVYFHLDPLWAGAAIDFVGIDNYLPLSDWRDGFDHLDAQARWPAIHDRAYLQSNIAGGEGFDWLYAAEADRAAQVRTPITDGAHDKPWGFRPKDLRAWWSNRHCDRPGGVEAGIPTAWMPESKPIRFTELGARPSTAAPTSRMSSMIQNRPKASRRISRAVGATTPSSVPISRRRTSSGANRRTTRPLRNIPAAWSK